MSIHSRNEDTKAEFGKRLCIEEMRDQVPCKLVGDKPIAYGAESSLYISGSRSRDHLYRYHVIVTTL
jgi:hypothetical protein